MKTIITSGYKYIDIDALACIYAYKELLGLKGEEVIGITTGEFNSSITKKYKDLDILRNSDELKFEKDDQFVIVDLSDPEHIEKFVNQDNISKIFDHHPGHEEYWKNKLKDGCIIEPIGAAATLIYREYKKENLIEKISAPSAELLAVAILSNTLNFQAKITKDEDRNAYNDLKQYFNYTKEIEDNYFLEVQEKMENDILEALRNDSKKINENLMIAQLESWDSERIILKFQKEILDFLNLSEYKMSFLNLIDLNKKINILIFKNLETLEYIKSYFPEFEYNIIDKTAKTQNVILRKEIMTRLLKS